MKLGLWAIVSHIKGTSSATPLPGLKVALITTFVPGSESVELLHKTLPAMRKVAYAHDTWLLDEGNDPEVQRLCNYYGVYHFSRNGKDHYNTHDGKFAKKTKGGNHNSWYDMVGNNYDIVAQMDTDFIPSVNFLTKTLGYFRDPKVAFVGTPQIYGNTNDSLIALGAAQQTYSFYGPLLRGMAGMNTAMLIGANHVIRVSALRSVDHYSAHITEDLLTGMKLHARGWKSVYVPEALAIGEGPITWKAYFAQQKRWAYGCMHILFNHSLSLFKAMSLRRIIYYFIIQQHYFGGIATFLSILCLVAYFAFGLQSTNVDLTNFLTLYVPVLVIIAFVNRWIQKFNIRPNKERGIMWAGMYIGIVAWPIYLTAFFALFKTKKLVYKVTPKGKKAKPQNLPVKLFLPHFALGFIALGCLVSAAYTGRDSAVMLFWAIVASVLLILVPIVPGVFRIAKRLSGKNKYVINNSTPERLSL
jgi:cellulose synthase/poly-beta-1,6-N-acetylglucosamine synthase-like glycosyltransferase